MVFRSVFLGLGFVEVFLLFGLGMRLFSFVLIVRGVCGRDVLVLMCIGIRLSCACCFKKGRWLAVVRFCGMCIGLYFFCSLADNEVFFIC